MQKEIKLRGLTSLQLAQIDVLAEKRDLSRNSFLVHLILEGIERIHEGKEPTDILESHKKIQQYLEKIVEFLENEQIGV